MRRFRKRGGGGWGGSRGEVGKGEGVEEEVEEQEEVCYWRGSRKG